VMKKRRTVSSRRRSAETTDATASSRRTTTHRVVASTSSGRRRRSDGAASITARITSRSIQSSQERVHHGVTDAVRPTIIIIIARCFSLFNCEPRRTDRLIEEERDRKNIYNDMFRDEFE
jgi:hypothetical protein